MCLQSLFFLNHPCQVHVVPGEFSSLLHLQSTRVSERLCKIHALLMIAVTYPRLQHTFLYGTLF